MQTTRSYTIDELQELLTTTDGLVFSSVSKKEAYVWIEETLRTYDYLHCSKPEKGILRQYLQKMTGFSRAWVTRLTRRYRMTTHVQTPPIQRHRFPRQYCPEDIALLADTDLAHQVLSGPATKQILFREYTVFRDERFARLSRISPSHIANLRKTYLYRDKTKLFQKTRPTQVPIGERRKPEPQGVPGFLRVDSVHQGDHEDGTKGVYHVNLVDEVTQWEIVVCVEAISERYMVPAVEIALQQFPFVIRNVHADNGSEYINHQVAGMLDRLVVKLTKSRPRHSNDNGLVETKNGWVIRKHLGYRYIPQPNAGRINHWYQTWFNVYLNFHRPCAFGREVVLHEKTGKRKRIYPTDDYQTPYAKFRSLPNAEQFLTPGRSFAALDQVAYAESDTIFAKKMQAAKRELFSTARQS